MTTSRLLFPLLVLLAIALIALALVPAIATMVPLQVRFGLNGGMVIVLVLLADEVLSRRARRRLPEEIAEPQTVKTVHLLGNLEPVTLYESFWGDSCNGGGVAGYYSTPEKAFQAIPSNSVRPVQFYKVGDHYIDNLKVRLRDLRVDHDI